MALDLWIPETARERRLVCEPCGMEFPLTQRQQWKRHVIACSKKHDDEIQAHVAAMEENHFTGMPGEVKEEFDWIRKRAAEGKKATKGGRPA